MASVVLRWDEHPVSQVGKRRWDLRRAADGQLRAAAPDRGRTPVLLPRRGPRMGNGWPTCGRSAACDRSSSVPCVTAHQIPANRASFRPRPSRRRTRRFRPTAGGSPTARTNPAPLRCTCRRSLVRAKSIASRPTAASNPAWSRNGRELFFLVSPVPGRPEVSMMAVEVSTEGGVQGQRATHAVHRTVSRHNPAPEL